MIRPLPGWWTRYSGLLHKCYNRVTRPSTTPVILHFSPEAVCLECVFYFLVNSYHVSSTNESQSVKVISAWSSNSEYASTEMTYPNPSNVSLANLTFTAEISAPAQYFRSQLTASNSAPNGIPGQVSLAFNITAMMADFWTSMSLALMNGNSGGPNQDSNGTAWKETPCIYVR